VTDPAGRSVAGARVSVPGYSGAVVTDKEGSFALPAHAPYGKIVTLHAEKGIFFADLPEPAGKGQITLKLHPP
jgi:hypothetical protein